MAFCAVRHAPATASAPQSLLVYDFSKALAASQYLLRFGGIRHASTAWLRIGPGYRHGERLSVVVADDKARRPRPPRYLESLLLCLWLGITGGRQF